MKILITGSNGLLGQKLVKALYQDNSVELLATARGENRLKAVGHFPFTSLDITDGPAVEALFRQFQPDVVIHTAAMTQVDDCENEQALCWQLNVTAVDHIVRACTAVGAHLVHLSTDFIFDGIDGPYTETAIPNPLSFYGKSKLAAEKLIQESSLSWSILRTVLVYGVAEDMSRSNIVLWAKSALEKGQSLRIVNDQFRTPTLAEDLAQGCILAAKQKAQGIYNISGSDYMSVETLVRRVARYFGLDESPITAISTASLNQRAPRPLLSGFIIDKAKQELGYSPHTFEQGIALVMEQAHPSKNE
jgi:dTDP-4-dehydrorhamnose reductase